MTLLSLLAIVFAISGVRAAPITPDSDPFYTPTGNWQAAAPGTLLSTRSVTLATYGGLLPIPVTAYQLLFRTTDMYNNPLAAVTTVMIPPNHTHDQLLIYSVPEDSTNTMCAPSYLMQNGLGASDTMYLYDQVVIQGALAQGWIVSSPDHEGPKSTYGAGRQEGRIVLDSIRVTLNFGPRISLLKNAKVALIGYSGGAIATGWAGALQKTYAPELTTQIVGYASGGTPSNVTATGLFLNGGPHSGYLFGALVGLSRAYNQFAISLARTATAKTKALIADDLANECDGDSAVDNVDFFNTTEYFIGGYATIYNTIWQSVFNDNLLGAGGASYTPAAPYYIFHSVEDDFIPYPTAPVLYNSWCGTGGVIQFVTNNAPGVGHGAEAVLGLPGAFQFLYNRLNGATRTPIGCTASTAATGPSQAQAIAAAVPGFADIYAIILQLL